MVLTVRVCPGRLEASTEECTALSWSLNRTIYLISLTPWWPHGNKLACRCGRHGFNPCSGKISHAREQLSWWRTDTEPIAKLLKPMCLELVLHNKRSHRNEKPCTLQAESSPHLSQIEKWPYRKQTQYSKKKTKQNKTKKQPKRPCLCLCGH